MNEFIAQIKEAGGTIVLPGSFDVTPAQLAQAEKLIKEGELSVFDKLKFLTHLQWNMYEDPNCLSYYIQDRNGYLQEILDGEFCWPASEEIKQYIRHCMKRIEEWEKRKSSYSVRRRKADKACKEHRELIVKEFNGKCLCCGSRKKLTIDHVVPISQGGTDDIENLQLLCRSCNSRKGTDTTDYRGYFQ